MRSCPNIAGIPNKRLELFRSRFGRWVLFFTRSSDVINVIRFRSFSYGFGNVFYFSLLKRMPFNWKTPFGYMILLSYEGVEAIVAAMAFYPIMSIFIGSCILLKTFIEDITIDLKCLNQKQNEKENLSEIFCNVIQNYSNVQELSEKKRFNFINDGFFVSSRFLIKTNEIYEFIITLFFVWIVFTLCCILLIINLELVEYIQINFQKTH